MRELRHNKCVRTAQETGLFYWTPSLWAMMPTGRKFGCITSKGPKKICSRIEFVVEFIKKVQYGRHLLKNIVISIEFIFSIVWSLLLNHRSVSRKIFTYYANCWSSCTATFKNNGSADYIFLLAADFLGPFYRKICRDLATLTGSLWTQNSRSKTCKWRFHLFRFKKMWTTCQTEHN